MTEKDTLIKIFNYYKVNNNVHKSIQSFYSRIYDENNGLLQLLRKDPATKLLLKNIEKEILTALKKAGKSMENINGKVFSRYLQGMEDVTLKSMVSFCVQNGFVVCVLMFDGLMVNEMNY